MPRPLFLSAGDSQALRTLVSAGRAFWWAPPLLIILGSTAAVTEGVSISLLIPLFSVIFNEESGFPFIDAFVGWLGKGLSKDQLVATLTLIVLVLAVLRAALLWAYEVTAIWVSGRVIHELRVQLFRQLFEVGYVFFLQADRGRLLDILRGETWRLGEVLLGISRVLIHGCTAIGLSLFLVMISPQLTLGVAVGVTLIALLLRLMVRRARQLGEEVVEASAALSRRTGEVLGAMRTIRLFGQERREQARLARRSDRLRRAVQRVDLTVAAIQPATELLYTPLFLGVLLAAWVTGIGFPTLIGFMAMLYRVQPHARRLDHLRVEIAGHFPIVRQIAGLLKTGDKPYVTSGTKLFPGLGEGVAFDAASFSYEADAAGRPPTVAELSFELSCRKLTAIVGESGAGKSTVVNLLFRLHDPTSGRILVDGTPLKELSLTDWRARLAFAGQDAELIGDTIHDAIAFGRPDADRGAVERAAEAANATEFILNLPEGYDTPIGPEGLRLSAGQRQRVALARALICEPDVLVLDEATSAVDALSERLIHEALERLRGSLTLVVVAHRLTSILDADHIVVLKQGRVAEQGSPRVLLGRGGVFAALWKAQGGRRGHAGAQT